MPYTFGASQADDATTGWNQTMMSSNTCNLVTGWWCPTNIAGTDVLWGAGNTTCVQMVTSTSVKLTTQNATTNGVWTGTLTALTNGVWAYLAFLATFNNTGPAGAVRMWQGTIDTAPVEVSVTQTTAPVGNFTGDNNFYIGNKGTSATDAYDGDIANVAVISNSAGNAAGDPLAPAVNGVWTQAETDLVGCLYVQQLWLGNYARAVELGRQLPGAQRPAIVFDLDNANPYGYGRSSNIAGSTNPEAPLTVNGATKSVVNGNPRPAISRPNWPRRRR